MQAKIMKSSSLKTLILLPTIFTIQISTCLNIFCDFSMQNFMLLNSNSIYTCTVADIKPVTEPNEDIINVYGSHIDQNKDENVHAIKITFKYVKYFPRKLESFFAFLSAISIISSNLTLLKQDDLTPFTNLRYLDMQDNQIEFLQRDLFVYNPNLEVINLSSNWVANIDPDVFDYLNNLRYLNLESNSCISDMERDKNGVRILITEVKEKCNNCDFEEQMKLKTSLENIKMSCKIHLDELKLEIEALRSQNFEVTRRAQALNGNLSAEIDKLNVKMAERKVATNRRIFILTIMLVGMCVLLIIFTGIIIYFIFNVKTLREKATKVPEVVEYSAQDEDMIVVRRTHGKKRLSENLYEDINGHKAIVESAYDKLQHL